MDLQTITDINQLKAMAYDQIASKEQAERNLNNINQRITQVMSTPLPKAAPDPGAPDARDAFHYSLRAFLDLSLRKREWASHIKWVNANVIGPPKATDKHTVESLQKMGMVGLYAKEVENAQNP